MIIDMWSFLNTYHICVWFSTPKLYTQTKIFNNRNAVDQLSMKIKRWKYHDFKGPHNDIKHSNFDLEWTTYHQYKCTTNKSSTLILTLSGPLTTSTSNNNDRLHAVMMLLRLIRFLTQKWIISPQTTT